MISYISYQPICILISRLFHYFSAKLSSSHENIKMTFLTAALWLNIPCHHFTSILSGNYNNLWNTSTCNTFATSRTTHPWNLSPGREAFTTSTSSRHTRRIRYIFTSNFVNLINYGQHEAHKNREIHEQWVYWKQNAICNVFSHLYWLILFINYILQLLSNYFFTKSISTVCIEII